MEDKTDQFIASLRNDSFLSSRYDFSRVLGEGCFGKIVSAYNKQTDKSVALKLERFKKSKIKMVLKN